jgi:hypothetical protein
VTLSRPNGDWPGALELAHRAAKETVTLIFSSHDTQHNNAVVLKEELDERVQRMAARSEHHPIGA